MVWIGIPVFLVCFVATVRIAREYRNKPPSDS